MAWSQSRPRATHLGSSVMPPPAQCCLSAAELLSALFYLLAICAEVLWLGLALVNQDVLLTQAYATVGDGPKWAGLDAATIAARVAAQIAADSASIRTAGDQVYMPLPTDATLQQWHRD